MMGRVNWNRVHQDSATAFDRIRKWFKRLPERTVCRIEIIRTVREKRMIEARLEELYVEIGRRSYEKFSVRGPEGLTDREIVQPFDEIQRLVSQHTRIEGELEHLRRRLSEEAIPDGEAS
jgi:hypothetical protein